MLKVTRRQYNMFAKIYFLLMTIVIVTAMTAQGILQGKMIETIFLLTAFLALKNLYPDKFHSNSLVSCGVYSVVIFSCLTRLSFPVKSSLLCAPVLGLLAAYAATLLAKCKIYISELQNKIDELMKPRLFDCKTATIEEFTNRCLLLGYDADKISFAIDALSLNRLMIKELVHKYSLSERTAKRKKSKIKQELKGCP